MWPTTSTAELQCFIELDWPMPRNVIDLWPEYRAITNGKRGRKDQTRLIDAMAYYQIDHISAVEKRKCGNWHCVGPPYTETESETCSTIAKAMSMHCWRCCVRVWPTTWRSSIPRKCCFAADLWLAQTRSDRAGIPLDVPLLQAIREHREAIHLAVIAEHETRHAWRIFDGGILRQDRVVEYLIRENIRLPVTKKTRRPSLADSVLKDYEERYPQLAPLRECLRTLNTLSRFGLPVDADGRSRFFANNFGTITGRNSPPASEFVFQLPGWARFLIKPPRGYGLAYLDYSAQEVAIAAALSGDRRMLADYYNDIYLQQAVKQGRAESGATKQTHGRVRDVFKTMVLGMNYGQTEFGIAARLQIPRPDAAVMRKSYLDTYPDFARWRQSIMNGVLRSGRRYFTSLGWPLWVDGLRVAADGERRSRAAVMRAMSNHPCKVPVPI